MNIKALRKGNYIYWDIPEKEGVVHVVTRILDKTVNTFPISLGKSMEDYLPIRLSEKWFQQFGFNPTKMVNGKRKYELTVGGIYFYATEEDNFSTCGTNWSLNIPPLKYVHQLQNLHFAISNKELQ